MRISIYAPYAKERFESASTFNLLPERIVGYTEAIAKPSFLGWPGVDEDTTRNHPTS